MLITCFQCRTQLDAPEGSAGKRVRCPHCNCVIVVPPTPRIDPSYLQRRVATPPMELDNATGGSVTQTTAHPLPPSSTVSGGELPTTFDVEARRPLRSQRAREQKRSWYRAIGLIFTICVLFWYSLRERPNDRPAPNEIMVGPKLLLPPFPIPPDVAAPVIVAPRVRQNPRADQPVEKDIRLDRRTIFKVTDDLAKSGSRTNEFTALTLHPTKPLAVVGTMQARVQAIWLDGEKVAKPIAPHENQPIEQLAISSDGRWLAVAVGGKIQLWLDWHGELPNKKRMIPGLRCVFTREHRLLVMSKDSIREYDPDSDKSQSAIEAHVDRLDGLALSPDGRLLAAHAGRKLLLWNWPERTQLECLDGHEGPITKIAFSPDGRTLASASADRMIKLWDVATRVERATLRQHAWTVWDLAFAPDGQHLASAGLDGMLLVWSLLPLEPCVVGAQAHHYPIRSLAWDREGKHLYFTCKHPAPQDQAEAGRRYIRKLCKIGWQDLQRDPTEAEKTVAQQAGLHLPSVDWQLSFSPDGQSLVTTTTASHNFSEPSMVRIWDAATARVRFAEPAMNGGALSPDGHWIAFSRPGAGAVLRLIEVKENLVLADRADLGAPSFPLVFYTADSTSLWLLQGHELIRYSVPALVCKQSVPLLDSDDDRTIRIVLSQDRLTFAVERISERTALRERSLHRASDGSPIPATALPAGVESASWRVRQSDTHEIELEDVLHGASQVIGQQRSRMTHGAVHPGGKIAATDDIAPDGSLRVHFWNIEEHRPILTLPQAPGGAISSLQFSPDGRHFAISTSAGFTRIVPIDWLLLRKDLLPTNPHEVGPP